MCITYNENHKNTWISHLHMQFKHSAFHLIILSEEKLSNKLLIRFEQLMSRSSELHVCQIKALEYQVVRILFFQNILYVMLGQRTCAPKWVLVPKFRFVKYMCQYLLMCRLSLTFDL